MTKLNQVIAVEKSVKSKVSSKATELYHASQKPELFEGFSKLYSKKNEEDETFPAESVRVRMSATEVLRQLGTELSELFDVTAQKDFANCQARADVVVDGKTLLKNAPATYLLFLEKQLVDLSTNLKTLPTLDPSQEWSWDSNVSLFKTQPTQTAKTKKVQKSLVLLQPTEKHPGQAVQVSEDIISGFWNTVRMSGALTVEKKEAFLERLEKLQKAVKFAREEANLVGAPEQKVGQELFTYLLG